MKKITFLLIVLLLTGCDDAIVRKQQEIYEKEAQELAIERAARREKAEQQSSNEFAKERAAHLKSLCSTTPYYNTTIPFATTLDDACQQASKENKLVFLLHLSGDFANNDFT